MLNVSTLAVLFGALAVTLAGTLARHLQRSRDTVADLRRRLEALQGALAESEAARAERDRRLRQAQRLAGLSTWEWTLSRDRARWGSDAMRLLSLVPLEDGAPLKGSIRHVVPKDQPRIREALETAFRSGEPLDLQFQVARGDGSLRCLNARAELIPPSEDRPARLIGTVLDITDYKEKEEALRRLATRDGLTGALTRHHFFTQAARELERARRYPAPLAVMMIDVDHLKTLNDAFGHGTGDAVLRQAVAAAAGSLRQTDLLGRYGGDEFAALLPNTDSDEAADIGERIRRAVARVCLPVSGPQETACTTVSIGVTALAADDDSIEHTFKRADKALYRAKTGGRNQVVMS